MRPIQNGVKARLYLAKELLHTTSEIVVSLTNFQLGTFVTLRSFINSKKARGPTSFPVVPLQKLESIQSSSDYKVSLSENVVVGFENTIIEISPPTSQQIVTLRNDT